MPFNDDGDYYNEEEDSIESDSCHCECYFEGGSCCDCGQDNPEMVSEEEVHSISSSPTVDPRFLDDGSDEQSD